MAETSADRVARIAAAALVCGAAFYVNDRFVLANFAGGADLLDTGWFAWIMAAGDPWLANPRSVSDLSYFNYHLTPYLSAITVFVHAMGVDRFTAFALHQGLAFAAFAAGLCGLVLTAWSGARSALLLLAVAVFALSGDVLLQVASFPHPEVAIIACCVLGSAFWQSRRFAWGAAAFVLACTVREDGGLYAAAFLFGLAALEPLSKRTLASLPALLGAALVLVSLLMFWIKAAYFPGFAAFATNYSGDGWRHLTQDSVRLRLGTFVQNPQALTSILCAAVLALATWRYLVFVVLMAPLIVAQLLAVRAPLWQFHSYYTFPFVVIWAGIVIVATSRARRGSFRTVEAVVLVAFIVLGSGPVQYLLRPPGWLPVAARAMVTSVGDLPAFAADLRSSIAAVPGACVSTGVAAMIPDAVAAGEVFDTALGLAHCRTAFLFRGDLSYNALSWSVALWPRGTTIDGRVERYDQRP